MKRRNLAVISFFLALGALVRLESQGRSGKAWIGRADEIEAILTSGTVASIEELGVGRNQPKRVNLEKEGQTASAIWKPIERGRHDWAWEAYQAEVAAYVLDKILELNMVPPTVERSIGEEKGSLQLWLEGCQMFEEVRDQAPNTIAWSRELSRMTTFDSLICNPDRSPRDFLVDSEWNIILIDHSQCFLSRTGLDRERRKVPSRFDRDLVERIKDLDLERLQIRFRGLLLDSQIRAIVERRDVLLAHINKLVMEKGDKAVFF